MSQKEYYLTDVLGIMVQKGLKVARRCCCPAGRGNERQYKGRARKTKPNYEEKINV